MHTVNILYPYFFASLLCILTIYRNFDESRAGESTPNPKCRKSAGTLRIQQPYDLIPQTIHLGPIVHTILAQLTAESHIAAYTEKFVKVKVDFFGVNLLQYFK